MHSLQRLMSTRSPSRPRHTPAEGSAHRRVSSDGRGPATGSPASDDSSASGTAVHLSPERSSSCVEHGLVFQDSAASARVVDRSDVVLGEHLSSSATCDILRGTFAGRPVLLKQFKTQQFSPNAVLSYLKREFAILSEVRHECILQLLGVLVDPMFALVTEYVDGGTLFDRIRRDPAVRRRMHGCTDRRLC